MVIPYRKGEEKRRKVHTAGVLRRLANTVAVWITICFFLSKMKLKAWEFPEGYSVQNLNGLTQQNW